MSIELIAKIAPKNDGFTGMVDADQVIGGGTSGTLPNATVAISNVTQHQGSIDHNSLLNYAANVHFTQSNITGVDINLATGLLKSTTGTGALSIITDNSTNWNNVHTVVNTNSTGWENCETIVNTNSTGWEVAEATLNNNSTDWENVHAIVNTNSLGWESTEATLSNNSVGWNSTETTLNTNSTDWESVYSITNTNSTGWENAETILGNNSAGWEGTESTVSNNSGDWGVGELESVTGTSPIVVNPTTGNASVSILQSNTTQNGYLSFTNWNSFNNATTTVSNNSVGWVNTETIVNTNSTGWENAEAIVNTNSAGWESTEATVNTNSVTWENVHTIVNTNSTGWENCETIVNTNSLEWENAETVLSNNSTGWEGTETTVNTNSGTWGTGDVSAASNMTSNTIIRGDDSVKGVQDSGIVIDDSDNVSSMGTLGCGAITSTGAIEGTSFTDGTATITSGNISTTGTIIGGYDSKFFADSSIEIKEITIGDVGGIGFEVKAGVLVGTPTAPITTGVGIADSLILVDIEGDNETELIFSKQDLSNTMSIYGDHANNRFLINNHWVPYDNDSFDLGVAGTNEFRNIYASGDLNLSSGNINSESGNLTLSSGSLTLTNGNIISTAGDFTMQDGDMTISNGFSALTYSPIADISDDTEQYAINHNLNSSSNWTGSPVSKNLQTKAQANDVSRSGTIDGWGAGCGEVNNLICSYLTNTAVYSGTDDYGMGNRGWCMTLEDTSEWNVAGKELDLTDIGLAINYTMSHTETAGTSDCEFEGINIIMDASGTTLTNGVLNTAGIHLKTVTGHSSGNTYGIWDESGADWKMAGNFTIGDGTATDQTLITVENGAVGADRPYIYYSNSFANSYLSGWAWRIPKTDDNAGLIAISDTGVSTMVSAVIDPTEEAQFLLYQGAIDNFVNSNMWKFIADTNGDLTEWHYDNIGNGARTYKKVEVEGTRTWYTENTSLIFGEFDATGDGVGYIPTLTPTSSVLPNYGIILATGIVQVAPTGATSVVYSFATTDDGVGTQCVLEYTPANDVLWIDSSLQVYDTDDVARACNFTIGESDITVNPTFKLWGYITNGAAAHSISHQISDTDDYYHITKDHANLLGLYIDMPTFITDKLAFTQVDGNEYIDSNNDNYIDVGATTGIRQHINGTEQIILTDGKLAPTTDNDIDLGDATHRLKEVFIYDGVDTVDQDLTIDCGTEKTVLLAEVVYKDINMAGYLLTKPASSAPGTVTFVDENGADTTIETYGFAIGEKVHGGFEIQHDYKEGTDLVFHVHWQGIAAPSGTDNVQWRLNYIVMRDGETLNAAVVIDSPDTAIDTQYDSLRTDFAAITGTNFKIGDQFMFTLTRVAATGDAYSGEALIATAGIHYQVDTIGSRQITTK